MENYTEKAESFLQKRGIRFTAARIGYGPYFPGDKESRDIYRLTLSRGRGRKTWFKFGASINDTNAGRWPNAYDLLACITKSDPGTFDNFCAEFGYDTDSRSAERTYKAVCREWSKVQRFFTAEEIAELVDIQ